MKPQKDSYYITTHGIVKGKTDADVLKELKDAYPHSDENKLKALIKESRKVMRGVKK